MKKSFVTIAFVSITAGSIFSCSNQKGCYEIAFNRDGLAFTHDFWGTKSDADTYAKRNYGGAATVKKVNKAEADCTVTE